METANRRIKKFAILVIASMAFAGACSTALNLDDHRSTQPWTYYLYLPETYTPDRAWPLFIGVNGSSADGRSCWNTWQRYADDKGFVLLCPELADSNGRLEQLRE